MVQYPVMVWVTRTFIGGKSYGWAGWLGFSVLAFVVSVVVSGLIYTYVDKPIMKNWARPKAGSKAPAQAQQPSAK